MRYTYSNTRRAVLLAIAAAGALALQGGGATAQQAEAPPDTILTVVPAPGAMPVHFTDADLADLPQHSFQTSTIWTVGVPEFSGPSLASVLAAAGMEDSVRQIRLTALNDYAVLIDIEQIEEDVPIIANRMNGATFSVRDKGPLWVVFPFDAAPRYRAETIFAISVWQLRHIEAL
ncbi:molybdopterin-dependent oxidoreductase [Maritalea mobilis]|uniref:molybdopterin-dependent oxidoreductase n=1 Tax=Maritalea mobilis TaxID=483324 RepID=UPI001C96461F|nr:molybdopterin-dependent oxidoreductase [Maritalea mobilis]MBY6201020.1 molybdopterin-dependent oxidoreductase [Maritalea mobilis]